MAADTVFIVNPASGNGRARRRWKTHEGLFRKALGHDLDVRFTERPGHGTELARTAVQNGASTVVSVGGDGTLNEVVNGLLDGTGRPWHHDVRLAVLSLGTGADFIKTLGLTREPEDVAALLKDGHARPLDVGLCEFMDAGAARARFFLNVAQFGSGGAVVDRANRTTKVLGGRTSFLIAILRTLPRYTNTRVAWRADGGARTEAVVNDFVVANGRFFGGGLQPAPHADPSDGLFDVIVIGDIDFKTARKNLPTLRAGTHLGMPGISSFRAREIAVEAHDEMIDLDGEFVGRRPRRFSVLPQRLPVLVCKKG